jgi:hypothetical protein
MPEYLKVPVVTMPHGAQEPPEVTRIEKDKKTCQVISSKCVAEQTALDARGKSPGSVVDPTGARISAHRHVWREGWQARYHGRSWLMIGRHVLWAIIEDERPLLDIQEEAIMAGQEKEAYVALIADRDPKIRALLDQGFEFFMNALKAGAAPPGIKAKTDREQVRSLRQEGYQVEVTTAYDEQGQPRPTLSAIWRKKR